MQYAQRRSPGANAVGIGFVVLLHIGIGYGLVTGLGVVPRPAPHETPVIFEIEQPKVTPPEEPLLQKPELTEPKPIYVPTPVVVITPVTPRSVPTTTDPPSEIQAFHPVPVPMPATEACKASVRLAGPALEYPPRLKVEGRTGSVDVECDIDDSGRTSMCNVTGTTGGNAFADAALRYVRDARYTPAMCRGVAVTEPHHRFHVTFDLN